MPYDDSRPRREPIFNAPVIVIGMALLLVALHGATYLLDQRSFVELQYDYALVPRRFWAEGGTEHVYPSMFAGLVTLVSTGFLHADWVHVLVNSAMLLAFGTPVARAMGRGPMGWLKWMAVFLGAVIGGSAAYLAATDVTSGPAVGASGGTSGLVAAAFLLDAHGRVTSLLSRNFLAMTFAFALANAVLTFAAPYLMGMQIAWEAHAGGYVAGAVLMLVLGPRNRPVPAG